MGIDWNECYVERGSYVIRKLRVNPGQSNRYIGQLLSCTKMMDVCMGKEQNTD